MTGQVRVLLTPAPGAGSVALAQVRRATVSLTPHGPVPSAVGAAPKPAALHFTAVLLDRAREPTSVEEVKLGTVRGEVSTPAGRQEAIFRADADGVQAEGESLPEDDPRRLTLAFAPGNFEIDSEVVFALPDDPDRKARYVEVSVELEVDGAAEAPDSHNDTLDLELHPERLRVQPARCLDTPVEEETLHNLVLSCHLASADLSVVAFSLDGQSLVEGEDFFQARGAVYFRTRQKPAAPVRGRFKTSAEEVFEFEVKVADTLKQRLASLSVQLDNARAMAEAAARRAADDGQSSFEARALRSDLLEQALARKFQLLDSIEQTLESEDDAKGFEADSARLPTLLDADVA